MQCQSEWTWRSPAAGGVGETAALSMRRVSRGRTPLALITYRAAPHLGPVIGAVDQTHTVDFQLRPSLLPGDGYPDH